MSDAVGRSLWADTLPLDVSLPRHPSLDTSIDADVVIVGAGFTGLWTAYYLSRHEPALRLVIVDRDVTGSGASGRNGGWVTTSLPMSPPAIDAAAGRGAAARMHRAMVDTVDEVGTVAARLDVACHFVKGGRLRFARNRAQERRVQRTLLERAKHGLDDAVWLDAREAASRAGASRLRGAMFTPNCARIHPGRLVVGLCLELIRSGVQMFEHSHVTSISQGRVDTERGVVRAPAVVLATEAFTATLPGKRRGLAPVSSLMIATQPLSPSIWDQIGLSDCEAFNDARLAVIYGQRTFDDRLAFGGLRAPYLFGSRLPSHIRRNAAVFEALRRTLVDLLPAVGEAAVTHRWAGVLALSRDRWARVGYDARSGVGWAGGYAGYGLAASNLAGRTLADLVLGRDSELLALPWVGLPSPKWPIEPVRWLWLHGSDEGRHARDWVDARLG